MLGQPLVQRPSRYQNAYTPCHRNPCAPDRRSWAIVWSHSASRVNDHGLNELCNPDQAELADKAGVALITVTRLENSKGDVNPRADTVRRIASALGVDPAWLLFGDDDLKAAA